MDHIKHAGIAPGIAAAIEAGTFEIEQRESPVSRVHFELELRDTITGEKQLFEKVFRLGESFADTAVLRRTLPYDLTARSNTRYNRTAEEE